MTKLAPKSKRDAYYRCDKNSSYELLRKKALSHSYRLANRGIKKGKKSAYAVTVDMCPSSKKGFEADFFKNLIGRQKNYPVTISLTQKWAKYHAQEFKQLKEWHEQKLLHITWMNHGSMHPYYRGVTFEKNFINIDGFNFKKEVLDNETFMLKEGLTPSIFYRFAGLVSNKKAYTDLIDELGLIPLGTLAWLAKGETIEKGSIVLVHGNKNEPLGIKRFVNTKITLPVVELPQLFLED